MLDFSTFHPDKFMAKHLTKEQRFEMIKTIIESDMEGLYKARDMFALFYDGVTAYKKMTNRELLEWYREQGMDIPKETQLTLLCTEEDCLEPQGEDEFCKAHSK